MLKRPGNPTSDPQLEWVETDDGSRTLRYVDSKVTWHSESGALAESKLVFLQNSGVEERLQNGEPTKVLEIGFGTGLNFWLAASVAINHGTRLQYTSLEPRLLDHSIVSELQHRLISDCQPAAERFFKVFREFDSKTNAALSVEENDVELRILRYELVEFFAKSDYTSQRFDAIFHDPFGPDDEADLWTEEVFHRLHQMLQSDGRLVTYCVKSEIQRRLKSVGFKVTKTRGPIGGKREVLFASKID